MRSKILFPFFLLALAFGLDCLPEPSDVQDEKSQYFPPPESAGGWRKNTDPSFIRSLGLDPEQLEQFGRFNLEVPNSKWMPYAKYK